MANTQPFTPTLQQNINNNGYLNQSNTTSPTPTETTTTNNSTTHSSTTQTSSQIGETHTTYKMLENLKRGPESVKLFIGQVPVTVNEAELKPIFLEYGNLHEVAIIRDRSSSAHRGCAFVTFEKKECADKALNALHNKVLPMTERPIQVKYADGEQDKFEFKLFIGLVPKTATEDDLRRIFNPYGKVIECVVLRTPEGHSRGCAFIKYEKRESALAAIEGLNQKYRMEGGNTEIVVRFADKKKKLQQSSQQQSQQPPPPQQQQQFIPETMWNMIYGVNNNNNNNNNFNSYPNAIPNMFQPQTNIPAAAGTSPFFPAAGSGIIPNTATPMGPPTTGATTASPFTPFFNPAATIPTTPATFPTTFPGNGSIPPSATVSPHTGIPLPNAMPSNATPTPNIPNPGFPMTNQQRSSTGNNPISNTQSGPTGANLFIYHLPPYFTDNDLFMSFSPFGNIVSVKVFIDKQTGNSKSFGFVSYDSPNSAHLAISSMNGFQIGNKRLKVQLKKENNRPY